jgi:hypothetical protein
VDDPEVRATMEGLFAEVADLEGVTRVESPYAAGGDQLIASQGPQAGKIALANVELPEDIGTDVAAAPRSSSRRDAPMKRAVRRNSRYTPDGYARSQAL